MHADDSTGGHASCREGDKASDGDPEQGLKEMLQTLSSPRLDRLLAVLHTLCKPQEAPDPCALDSSVKKDG